jgi:DNA polymerase-3 subunit delta'
MASEDDHSLTEAKPRTAFRSLLPWQVDAARAMLAQRARWPHALLLHGRKGLGKRTFAVNLACALLCENPLAGGGACGHCSSCGYVAAGQHPDLRMIEPVDVDDEGNEKPLAEIPIRHIRALIDFVQITSHRRVAKVSIIHPAEKLNHEAANALLKTLEEPPPATYLLLVANQAGRLPATVRSRCHALGAPQPRHAEASEWLTAQGVRAAQLALAQAGHAPLVALALADPAHQNERSVWLKALARPDTLSPVVLSGRIDAAGKDARKDRLGAAVDWLLDWTCDLARVAAGGGPSRNPDFEAALAALARRVARVSLFRYHRSLLRQRALIAHPLQPRLVAEALLIEYRLIFD